MKHTAPVLIILTILAIVGSIILPSFKNLPQSTATPTYPPTPSPTSTPTPTSTSKPIPTKTPGTSKPTTTAQPAPVTSTSLPKNGITIISVPTDVGIFKVIMGAADVATTKVVVDTASDSDCTDNCPVLPLAGFISRRNAYAGINGTFFCPAEPAYASCGANNSFNFLVMNVNKTYLNSSMNVYSTNPGAIFASGYVRFVGAIQEWGRDTGPDGVISNYPLLISGGNISFNGSGDSKMNVKTTRSFVANKGNTVYIGDVFGASASDVAHVLKTLGVDNALNLDDAGSAAFWWGGYKVGPGRNIPNAILFINR